MCVCAGVFVSISSSVCVCVHVCLYECVFAAVLARCVMCDHQPLSELMLPPTVTIIMGFDCQFPHPP